MWITHVPERALAYQSPVGKIPNLFTTLILPARLGQEYHTWPIAKAPALDLHIRPATPVRRPIQSLGVAELDRLSPERARAAAAAGVGAAAGEALATRAAPPRLPSVRSQSLESAAGSRRSVRTTSATKATGPDGSISTGGAGSAQGSGWIGSSARDASGMAGRPLDRHVSCIQRPAVLHSYGMEFRNLGLLGTNTLDLGLQGI